MLLGSLDMAGTSVGCNNFRLGVEQEQAPASCQGYRAYTYRTTQSLERRLCGVLLRVSSQCKTLRTTCGLCALVAVETSV